MTRSLTRHGRMLVVGLPAAAACLAAGLAAGAGLSAAGAGGNDDFDSATQIVALPFTDTTDTRSATKAADDPLLRCGDFQRGAKTVWWKYTPVSDTTLLINTFGSGYDTVLAVWTGNRGALQAQACNDDASAHQSQVWIEATAGTTYFIEAADYDSASGQGGTLQLGVATQEPTLAFDRCIIVGELTDYVYDLAVSDLDKDQWPDIVSADGSGGVTAWRNDGSPFTGSWSGTAIDTREGGVYSLGVADLDKDTWPDVATGDGNYEVAVFRNDTTPFNGPWASTVAGGRDEPIISVAIGDLDKDSWPDLVSGDADTDVFVWRNDGTPFAGTWPANQVGSSTDYIVSVDVADLNRDSWPDIVTGDDGDNVAAWQNDGSPFQSIWPSHLIGQSANDLECVATVDLDNDQWIDVATGNDATMVQAWRNDTSPFVGGWTVSLVGTSPDHIQSLAVGDLDNDGWTDVVTGDDSGKVVAWENPMAPFGQNWAPLLVYPDGDYVHGLALADLDGDGDLDLVAGDEDRLIVACENLHAADPTPTSTVVASSTNPSKVGQAVTFTATVTPVSGGGTPTGTVQFSADGEPLGSPVGLAAGAASSAPTSALAAGERAITAAYSGDTTFAASVSAPLNQTVREFDAPGDFTVGGMLGVGLAAPERAVHIRGGNAVFRMDRDRDTAAFILTRTDAAGGALKTFVVGVNASASGTGSFVVNDLGAATGGAGSNRLTIADDGDAVFAGSLTAKGFFPPSSRGLKTDVRPLGEALESVLHLQGVRYTSRLTGAQELGLIAEDAGAVVGEVVSAPGDAVATIGIDYARLTPLLIEAVKHQEEAIRTLRLRNRNLESLLKELQELRRREGEE